MEKKLQLITNTLSTPLVYYTKSSSAQEKSNELVNEAFKAQENQKIQDSFNLYQAAIRLDDNNYCAYNNVGILLADYKNINESINLLETALNKFPKNIEMRYNLGTLYLNNNNFKQAQLQLDQAYSLMTDNISVMNNLALSYSGAGLWNESKKILEQILEKDNKFLIAKHNLGHVLYQNNEYEKSLKVFKEALEINPNEVTLNYAACAAYGFNKTDEAILYLKQALEMNPNFKNGYYNLGFICYQEKSV
jgi:tetratricopeptide (TPR) repeat protein